MENAISEGEVQGRDLKRHFAQADNAGAGLIEDWV